MKKNTIIGVLIVIAGIAVLSVPFFLKVRVVCKSQYGACPKEVESEVLGAAGKSLTAAKSETKKNLKNSFLVSDYSTQFKLPNILLVYLIVKKPAFAIADPVSGQFALVGHDGTIVAVSSESSLPYIVTNLGEAKVGDNVGSTNINALKLIEGVFNMYQVREGKLESSSLVVELPPVINVIFPLDEDVPTLLGSLRLIYSRIQSESDKNYSQIDLRFKNPVLR